TSSPLSTSSDTASSAVNAPNRLVTPRTCRWMGPADEAATVSSRGLSPGSSDPLAPAPADEWMPGTSPGMTSGGDPTALILRRRLGLVALGPLREHARAIVRHLLEVDLGHAPLRVRRIVLRHVLHLGMGNDGEKLRVHLVGGLGHGEVRDLLGGVGLL